MHQPPTIPAVVALVVLLAGCAHDSADPAVESRPADGAPLIARALELDPSVAGPATPAIVPAGSQAGESSTAGDGDEPSLPETAPNGPEAVAARRVIELLEAEGLYVLHLETHPENNVARGATGRVSVVAAVLHGTGRSHPHHARYRLELVETDAGWNVTAIDAAS